MYARASYITAVGIVELPYIIAQTIVFVPIAYFMIGECDGLQCIALLLGCSPCKR